MNNLLYEERLLVLCSRVTFDSEIEKSLNNILTQKLNWYRIVNLAIRNRVLGLVWKNLIEYGHRKSIPRRIQEVVELYFNANTERNKVLLEECSSVLNLLKKNDVIGVPLKGAFITENVFGDIGSRIMSDIDIMISTKDKEKVVEIIKERGYAQGDYNFDTNKIDPISRERQLKWKFGVKNIYPLRKITGNHFCKEISIDFCFGLEGDETNQIVDDMLVSVEFNEKYKCYMISNECFFIHLCNHLYKEAKNATWIVFEKEINLLKFCDVREYIFKFLRSEDNLSNAIKYAIKHKQVEALYFTLYYLNIIFNDGYEEKVMSELQMHLLDTESINTFGEKDYGEKITWKKSFWDRIFTFDNSDELEKTPKFLLS